MTSELKTLELKPKDPGAKGARAKARDPQPEPKTKVPRLAPEIQKPKGLEAKDAIAKAQIPRATDADRQKHTSLSVCGVNDA